MHDMTVIEKLIMAYDKIQAWQICMHGMSLNG